MSIVWHHVEGHKDYCGLAFGLGECDCKPEPAGLRAAYIGFLVMYAAWLAFGLYKLGAWIESWFR